MKSPYAGLVRIEHVDYDGHKLTLVHVRPPSARGEGDVLTVPVNGDMREATETELAWLERKRPGWCAPLRFGFESKGEVE